MRYPLMVLAHQACRIGSGSSWMVRVRARMGAITTARSLGRIWSSKAGLRRCRGHVGGQLTNDGRRCLLRKAGMRGNCSMRRPASVPAFCVLRMMSIRGQFWDDRSRLFFLRAAKRFLKARLEQFGLSTFRQIIRNGAVTSEEQQELLRWKQTLAMMRSGRATDGKGVSCSAKSRA